VVAWDSFEPFAVLDAGTVFVFLPAWIVLVVAGVARQTALAVAALIVVVAQIAFLLPEFTAAQPVPAWTSGAPAIRLFDANVYSGNPSMTGYVREIDTLRPDIVTLEEATPPDVEQLVRSGALDRLPYRIQLKRFGPTAYLASTADPSSSRRPFTSPRGRWPSGTSTHSRRSLRRSRNGRATSTSSSTSHTSTDPIGCWWWATSMRPGGTRDSGPSWTRG
jgi:hypothetical protein